MGLRGATDLDCLSVEGIELSYHNEEAVCLRMRSRRASPSLIHRSCTGLARNEVGKHQDYAEIMQADRSLEFRFRLRHKV